MPKHTALIIEDDPTLNEIMALTLNADFEVETCADGHTGLARLKEVTPNIIVLDLNLPGVSGKEILTAIRADERFAQTRVILTTADERKAEVIRDEVDIVLLKPVSPVQLRELALRLRTL